MFPELELYRHAFPHPLTDHQSAILLQYLTALLAYNEHTNLTAHRDLKTLLVKGVLDSLLFPSLKNRVQGRWLDVGSGAGFPGIPLAIQNTDVAMTLLEPIAKKARFLQSIQQHYIPSLHIVIDRAEHYIQKERERFDGVVSRAVASLPMLLELCLPFVRVGGYFLAYKGELAPQEINVSQNALYQLGGEVETLESATLIGDDAQRYLIVIRKTKPTPVIYPRMFSQIKNSPL